MISVLFSALAILACGALGGAAGYLVRAWLELGGVGGALVALVVAMFVATLAWAIGATILRHLGAIR
jgi:hypothetical protein